MVVREKRGERDRETMACLLRESGIRGGLWYREREEETEKQRETDRLWPPTST